MKLTPVLGAVIVLAIGFSVRLIPPGPPVQPPGERKPMPKFTYLSLAGEPWSLADRKGQIVLVNFWATWCAPCREETPDLVRLHAIYGRRGVEFAGITTDNEPMKVVPEFLDDYDVRYPILVPPAESALSLAIEVLPTTFLVDRSGRIARTWCGLARGKEVQAAIEALLAETY